MKNTPFHPWRSVNPSPSTWEMTPPSFQKDKVLLILKMVFFSNVLYVPSLTSNLLSVYQMTHTGVPKRVSFIPNYVDIMDLASEKLIAKGLANHHARAYEFSHFVPNAKPTALLTHGNEVSRLWHERFGHLQIFSAIT